MQEHVNILIADDDAPTAETASQTLRAMGHACTVAANPMDALERTRSGNFEIIISNLALGGGLGREVLRTARSASPNSQVIVVADGASVSEAVAAMTEGAMTYLQKPLNPAELAAVVERASEYISLRRDRESLQSEIESRYGLENIIGNSRPMLKVFEHLKQAAATDATVLIQGETGTGKELVARAIHYNSHRRSNRLVPLNCAGLVETILESELFGHEKGAFTGAVSSRIGRFEYANHGTIFLDEIGDMPVSSQVKLLRVLEHNEIVRVGSNEPFQVDVRVIAATHTNLLGKVKDEKFRRDLFYRLNVVTINLPPLRERQSDIVLLTDHFVSLLSKAHGKIIHGMTPGVKRLLFSYDWPGNVRELKNILEHMIVFTTDDELAEDDLPEYLLSELEVPPREPTLDSLGGQPLEEVEKYHIARTLDLVRGNREKAAQLLGIGERTLYRKIEKYNLRSDGKEGEEGKP